MTRTLLSPSLTWGTCLHQPLSRRQVLWGWSSRPLGDGSAPRLLPLGRALSGPLRGCLRQRLVLGYVGRADGARLGEPPVKHKLPRRSCEELLLLQPHGFEGLVQVGVYLHARLLSVADREDLCERHVNGQAGGSRPPVWLTTARTLSPPAAQIAST